jgi:hypothetical protein
LRPVLALASKQVRVGVICVALLIGAVTQRLHAFLYINNVEKAGALTKTPFYVGKRRFLKKNSYISKANEKKVVTLHPIAGRTESRELYSLPK